MWDKPELVGESVTPPALIRLIELVGRRAKFVPPSAVGPDPPHHVGRARVHGPLRNSPSIQAPAWSSAAGLGTTQESMLQATALPAPPAPEQSPATASVQPAMTSHAHAVVAS